MTCSLFDSWGVILMPFFIARPVQQQQAGCRVPPFWRKRAEPGWGMVMVHVCPSPSRCWRREVEQAGCSCKQMVCCLFLSVVCHLSSLPLLAARSLAHSNSSLARGATETQRAILYILYIYSHSLQRSSARSSTER